MNIGIDIDDTICNSWDSLIDQICNDFKLEKRKVIKSKKIIYTIQISDII